MIKKMKAKVLFFLFFLFCIVFINDGLFDHDSVQLAKSVEEGTNHMAGKQAVIVVYSVFYFILNNFLPTDFLFNFVNIIFATATLIVLYYIVKELYNKDIAFYSALLFGFSPIFLSVSTYAKSHTVSLFFILLSFYTLIKYVKEKRRFYFLFFIFFYLIAVLSRYENVIFIPLFFYYLFSDKKLRLLPLYIILICFTGLFAASSITPAEFSIAEIPKNMFFSLFVLSDIIILPEFIIIFIILLLHYIKKESADNNKKLFTLWFFITYIPLSMVTVFSARLFILSLIPIKVFVVDFLYKNSKKKIYLNGIIALILVINLIQIIPVLHYRHNHCSGKELGLFVNEKLGNEGVFIINDESVFINYYANISTSGYHAGLEIDNYLDNNVPVFLFSKVLDEFGNKTFNRYKLKELYKFEMDDYHHAELKLRLYERKIYSVLKK